MSTPFFHALPDRGVEVLHPLPASASGWSQDQIRGMAVSGALARATEKTAEKELSGMRPTRWSVDLFRPARVRPTHVAVNVIRRGRRIGLIDAELRQEGRPVARSRALFARPTRTPQGQVWTPDHTTQPPPAALLPTGIEPRLYHSEAQGWTAESDHHHNNSRKQVWHHPIPLVEGELLTRFQMVASVADLASMAVNWGSSGIQYINADIDAVLTRLPTAMEIGLSASYRSESNGISVGTAIMFDRQGTLGSVSVVALANPTIRVDPGNRNPGGSAFTSNKADSDGMG